ncbi:hypothetical protein FCM35_KLT02988 [Carex littledalei]|uniref:Uncharacterized protein n=1 Tax=Carex littledalei TaxID=544730 RepID=A0A833R3Y8_9POAL|nr:hypothetical protein FCM35_KLT02988 [Carex littledalei]
MHCSCSTIREVSDHSTELKKKRKLLCEHTDLESPISKQKLENQHVMELAESSENSVNSPFTNTVHNVDDRSMVQDWSYTSSSSCSSGATSSSTFSSSAEFDSGASTSNFGSGGIDCNCKKELFKELEALHDPFITELVKSSSMVGGEDADADTSDSMLLDESVALSTLTGIVQDGRAGSRELTIDQEFEQYFSKLML